MGTKDLVAAPPSGRSTPLLIDDGEYAQSVIRQGAPIPWGDLAALTAHVGQIRALLDPDAAWIDVEPLVAALLDERPDLVTAMGARTRRGYALRTLLADDELVEKVVTTVATLATSARRPAVLDIPSPARWLARAHAVAGTALDDVDEDAADSASMYVAQWLGNFGRAPIALVLLDARGDETVAPERLGAYTALSNVAAHFDWSLALRSGDAVETAPGDPTVGLVPREFWLDNAELPAADLLLACIPSTAEPERVLDQLARIR